MRLEDFDFEFDLVEFLPEIYLKGIVSLVFGLLITCKMINNIVKY